MNLRFASTFLADESGAITVEAVILFAGFFGIAATLSNQIVVPLVENAHAQAQLNADSIAIIEQALATCGTAL